jgi:hypothetical protein
MDHLYWLSYHHQDRVYIVLQPAMSLMHARVKAALAKLDEGRFAEGHQIDEETTKWVPPKMLGRRLTMLEAMKLLSVSGSAQSGDPIAPRQSAQPTEFDQPHSFPSDMTP